MSPNRKTVELWVLYLFGFISMMGIGISFPTISFITLEPKSLTALIHASSSQRVLLLGLLLAISPLISLFFAPIGGIFADEKGRRPVLLFALLFLIISSLLSAVAVLWESLSLLILGRILGGIGSGGGAVLSAAIADLSSPEKKAGNFALFLTAGSLGYMVGPFLGGKLSEGDHFQYPFLMVAALSLINFILILFLFKESLSAPKKKISFFHDFKQTFSYPNIRLFLFLSPLLNIGFVIYWQFISYNLIQEYGFSEARVGDFYAYGAAWFAFSSGLLVRPFLSRFRTLPTVFFTSLLLAFSILFTLFRKGAGLFWISLPFQEFFAALLGPSIMAFLSNGIKPEDQGKVLGVAQSLGAAGLAISPILGGIVSGISLNAHILFAGLIILAFSGALFFGYRFQIFNSKT